MQILQFLSVDAFETEYKRSFFNAHTKKLESKLAHPPLCSLFKKLLLTELIISALYDLSNKRKRFRFLENPWFVSAMAYVGKFGIAASFAVIYVFASELYPTVVRAIGMGMSSMVAGFGLILGPQLVRLVLFFALNSKMS